MVYIPQMAISAQRGEPFVFYITPSVVFRVIVLAYAALPLLIFTQLILKVGLSHLVDRFRSYPPLWWLVILGVASVAFGLRLTFPPRRTQAMLHIRKDSVRFTPRRMDQRLSGESVVEAAVTVQSREILLSHNFFEGLPNGYRIIVRGADEPEREVRVKFYKIPDAQDCRNIAEAITAATGLPVRLVTRRRLMDGTVQETPWMPVAPRTNRSRGFALATIAAVPYVGGIIVGYLLPRPAIIAGVGLALWCGQMLAVLACGRLYGTRTKFPTLYSLTTVFTFGAAYGLAVVVVGFVLRAR